MPAPTSPLVPSRNIRLIVIHCSASPNERSLFTGKAGTPGFRDPVHEIDAWHKQRAFKRDTYWRGRQNSSLEAIGYHYVIARNGALFTGRHEDEPGAHVAGWNAPSLGICLVGTDKFTDLQWAQLALTVSGLAKSGSPFRWRRQSWMSAAANTSSTRPEFAATARFPAWRRIAPGLM